MKKHCDTVIVILNDKLREVLGGLTISNAFAQADNVLTTAAKSIAEIITVPGYVNVDFEDVKTVMKKAGTAVMGSAQVDGEDRAQKAAEMALDSPLLNYRNVKGAKKILLSIVSGVDSELQMDELSLIADYIQEQVGCDAEMIFGHSIDKQLQDGIRVTLIATGFDDNKEASAPEDMFYKQILKNNKPRENVEREEIKRENIEKQIEASENEVFDLNDNKMVYDYYSTPAYKRCNITLLSEQV